MPSTLPITVGSNECDPGGFQARGVQAYDIEGTLLTWNGDAWQPLNGPQTRQLQAMVSGAGIPTRTSLSPNVYGNAGVIDALDSDQSLWNLWCFGDSRTAGIINSKFLARAPAGTPIGGYALTVQTPQTVSGMASGQQSVNADTPATSPYVGFAADPICRWEFQTAAATTPSANNTITRRLTYTVNTVLSSTFPAFWSRLTAGRRSWLRGVSRLSTAGWSSTAANMPTVHIHARPNAGAGTPSDTGYLVSQPVPVFRPDLPSYVVGQIAIPSTFDWSTNPAPDIGWIVKGDVAVATANKVAAVSCPWIELSSGLILRETGCVGGRSILALTDEEITPSAMWSGPVRACGGKHALWLEIGTNNTPSYTTATFRQQLELVIRRFRAAVGDAYAPVVLITAYAASGDSGTPYYVTAAREVAQADNCAVCIDTYAALPTYSAGSGLGYYTDTVHYNSTGNDAFADAYWSLWNAA